MCAFARPLLALAALLLVAGCDVFGPSTETLTFRPLLNSDTFVTGEPEEPQAIFGPADRNGSRRSRALLFRSEVDVEFFTDLYTVSEPFPEVDFETESVIGYFLRDNRGDAFVDIQKIERCGEDKIVLFSDFGGVGVSANEPASRFVVQLVAVPRIEVPFVHFESSNINRL